MQEPFLLMQSQHHIPVSSNASESVVEAEMEVHVDGEGEMDDGEGEMDDGEGEKGLY